MEVKKQNGGPVPTRVVPALHAFKWLISFLLALTLFFVCLLYPTSQLFYYILYIIIIHFLSVIMVSSDEDGMSFLTPLTTPRIMWCCNYLF